MASNTGTLYSEYMKNVRTASIFVYEPKRVGRISTIDGFFRVISADTYLADFASDRRHMKRPDGSWIKPPPSYPPIKSSCNTNSLGDFICMTYGKGPGTIYSLSEFVHTFYKAPNLLAQ